MILLLVNKSTYMAELRTFPQDFTKSRLIQSFHIALGKNEGDKETQGDLRTPEGIYFTEQHIDTSTLPQDKYGKKAISLNFPNPMDRLDLKSGSGIWLHGAGNDERMAQKKVTEGCVAFYNSEFLKASDWLSPYQSIVVIDQDLKNVNKSEDIEQVKKQTLSWLESWRKQDLERYLAFYDADFIQGHFNKDSFSKYKKRVFHSYHTITVEVELMRVVTHSKYAMATMNMDFRGDNRFRANGRKIVYWQRSGSQKEWKIQRENFDKRPFAPHQVSLAQLDKHKS